MHLLHTLGVGGMEVGITKLVNSLERSRVASSICSCCPADTLKQRLRPDIRLFEFRRRQGNDPVLVAQLARLLRQERPHVLHTHAWGTLCEGVIAARLAGIPFVVHGEHGTLDTRARNVVVQRWMWRRVDRLLSVSSRLAERMAREVGFPLDRITVIRNGVDLARFAPRDRALARAALGLPPDGLIIGTVGRLVPVKDQATLLRSIALLRDRGVSFSAVIAGAGPLQHDLLAQKEALGLEKVHFLGNRGDVETVLAALDVFVLSSKSEGLSNTIQEAMATGVPVVATRVGGADELVVEHESGLLIAPQDPEVLADALHRLVHDSAGRERMGLAGRRRAEALFGLEGMIRTYENMYLSLANRLPERVPQPNTSET
jgi:sugar transferase (PEP-CTERM/EpsH1 system associated)